MSTKKRRKRKKQKVYTIHWPVLLGLTCLLVALVLLFVGVVRAIALPEGRAMTAEEATHEPIIPAPTWSPLPVDVNFTKIHSTTVKVFFPEEGEIREMYLEEYILGVVAGEMPSSYSLEALKAQAVAARTYTLYSMRHGGCNSNSKADVCTSSSCCQTYRTEAKMHKSWGDTYTYRYSVIAKAVMDTAGEIMLYKGKPINAMYHAASGGWTEDSENVYGSKYDYLRSVESPDEIGSRQTGQQVYTRKEVADRINGARPSANVDPDKLEEHLVILSLFPSGRVEKVKINEDEISGRNFKKIFGLDSAMFTVEITADQVIFRTKGFGHGVGMSQAGANGMGAKGADYHTILSHYYTGISFGIIGQY